MLCVMRARRWVFCLVCAVVWVALVCVSKKCCVWKGNAPRQDWTTDLPLTKRVLYHWAIGAHSQSSTFINRPHPIPHSHTHSTIHTIPHACTYYTHPSYDATSHTQNYLYFESLIARSPFERLRRTVPFLLVFTTHQHSPSNRHFNALHNHPTTNTYSHNLHLARKINPFERQVTIQIESGFPTGRKHNHKRSLRTFINKLDERHSRAVQVVGPRRSEYRRGEEETGSYLYITFPTNRSWRAMICL